MNSRPVVSILEAGRLRWLNLERRSESCNTEQKTAAVRDGTFSDTSALSLNDCSMQASSLMSFVCQVCKSTFGSQSGLRNHQSQHFSNVESGFFCRNCSTRFNSNASLYRHKRLVHSSHERRYIHNCGYCHKGYFNKTDLMEHLYKHTNVPGFSCDLCDKKFRSKVMLRNHKRDLHCVKTTKRTVSNRT